MITGNARKRVLLIVVSILVLAFQGFWLTGAYFFPTDAMFLSSWRLVCGGSLSRSFVALAVAHGCRPDLPILFNLQGGVGMAFLPARDEARYLPFPRGPRCRFDCDRSVCRAIAPCSEQLRRLELDARVNGIQPQTAGYGSQPNFVR